MEELIAFVPWALVVLGLSAATAVVARRLKRTSDELHDIEDEEERMFEYLHELGVAIDPAITPNALYRTIVEGLTKVVTAQGGALYLYDERGELLLPKHLSEDCPALVRLPDGLTEKAQRDPRALESYLRLATVPADEGIFGAVASAGEPLHVPDVRGHEAFRHAEGELGGTLMSVMIAPLRHAGKDLGVLAVTRRGDDFSPNDFSVFRSTSEQAAFALGNALVYREAQEKRQFESDLRNASEVQRVLLPQGEPMVPGYRIAGTNLPARIISGDYYDHMDLGGGLHGVVIADVSGKGVGAGLLMAMCRSVLRAKAVGLQDPAEVLGKVNRLLFPDIREDMFISLYYGVIDGDGGTIRLARAGHDVAFVFRAASGEVEEVKPPGLALGIDEGDVFERVTKVHEVKLEAGDVLFFHTDGVKEAMDGSGEEFGGERLKRVFVEHARRGAEAVITGVQHELSMFCGDVPQMDDVTLLAIEKR